MTMGLLDFPAPLLSAVDSTLASLAIPELVRIVFWGSLGGTFGMWLYKRFSPQAKLATLRLQLRAVQQQLARYDGDFGGLRPLILQQFGLVFRQLRLTAGGALLAGLPVLLMLPWLSNAFDARFPGSGDIIAVCVQPRDAAAALHWRDDAPATGPGCWNITWPAAGTRIQLVDGDTIVLAVPTTVPSRMIHKREGFNTLIGNPAGYLDDASRVHVVTIDLPTHQILRFGPDWMRGWEFAFFIAALLVSLVLRSYWKLN